MPTAPQSVLKHLSEQDFQRLWTVQACARGMAAGPRTYLRIFKACAAHSSEKEQERERDQSLRKKECMFTNGLGLALKSPTLLRINTEKRIYAQIPKGKVRFY